MAGKLATAQSSTAEALASDGAAILRSLVRKYANMSDPRGMAEVLVEEIGRLAKAARVTEAPQALPDRSAELAIQDRPPPT